MTNLFHISKNDRLEVLKPRIPDNIYTRKGYEENTIKRSCVSTDITGCLAAMGYNIENEVFNVYIVTRPRDIKIVNNINIVKNNWVPDAALTKEAWLLKEAEVTKIGKIAVESAIDKVYKYILNDGQDAGLKYWNWDWIEKIKA
jgi:hypothetical protein